jgi:epsilon-lactone hydrolase
MRSTLCALVTLALVSSPALAQETSEETSAQGTSGQGTTWAIGPRSLPPPANASAELRDLLAAEPTPRLKLLHGEAPTELFVWKGLIALRDEEAARNARTIATEFDVTVREDRIHGVTVYWVDPPRAAPEHKNHLFVHVHGGAWLFNGGLGATAEAALIAARDGIPVVSIDYRRAPEFPHPAAMDDIVAVWSELLKTHSASQMALGGTSAGGNLTLVATLRFKDLGLPLPGAIMLGTPAVDMMKTGDSRFLNDGVDHGLAWDGDAAEAVKIYADGHDYGEPYLSPIHGDVSGFPPAYLVTGTRDLLLSDTVLMHAKLRRAGVRADLHVYEGFAHADYLKFYRTPESEQHFAELNAFLIDNLAK